LKWHELIIGHRVNMAFPKWTQMHDIMTWHKCNPHAHMNGFPCHDINAMDWHGKEYRLWVQLLSLLLWGVKRMLIEPTSESKLTKQTCPCHIYKTGLFYAFQNPRVAIDYPRNLNGVVQVNTKSIYPVTEVISFWVQFFECNTDLIVCGKCQLCQN
jgi:hypothetical protein